MAFATNNGIFLDVNRLSSLFPYIIAFLEIESNDTVFNTVAEIMVDFMEWSDKLVNRESMSTMVNLFSGPWSASNIQKIVADPDSAEEGVVQSFLTAFISFGELTVKDISGHLFQAESQRIIELHLSLLQIKGYPIEDEAVSKRTLEFWDLFVESVLYDEDGVLQGGTVSESTAETTRVREIMMNVIELLWQKLRIPPSSEFVQWSRDSCDQFFAFRKDVGDLIESSYQIVQPKLYSVLVEFIIQALLSEDIDWAGVEASLFALNAISQSLTSSPVEYDMLKVLLDSNLFKILPVSSMPRAKQTSITFIASVIPFFQSDAGKEYILVIVPYLFHCLATPSMSLHASRSIYQLCSECAADLVPNIRYFLSIFRDMIVNGYEIEGLAKERISGAVAEVIQQGEPDLDQRAKYIAELVGSLELYAEQAISASQSGQQQIIEDEVIPAKEIAASALKSLAMVGKACRDAEDIEYGPQFEADKQRLSQFWDEPGSIGRELKDEILNIVAALCEKVNAFAGEITVRQNACAVLRCGFSEKLPGPFTWRPEVIIGYVREEVVSIGHITTLQPVFALASQFLAGYSDKYSPDASRECSELLDILYSGVIVPNLSQNGARDPDVNQGMLELLQRYLGRYRPVLFSSYCFEPLVGQFAVQMLSTREPLVVKAAVKFWTALVSSSTQTDGSGSSEDEAAKVVYNVVQATGFAVVEKVAWAITGNAPRSLLSDYAQLVKIYFRLYTGFAQKWLSTALSIEGDNSSASLSSGKMNGRRVFIEKIVRLRGRPPTETIVKEFWLTERGQEVDFA